MLTFIGRAAARRALASAAPSRLALGSSAAVHVRRGFSGSAWARAASAATAKRAGAAKTKTAKPKAKAAKTSATKAKKKAPAKKEKPVLKKKKVVKKKAVKKPKKKTPPTPEQKEKAQVRELKRMALLKGPKMLPANPWAIYVSQNLPAGDEQLGEKIKKVHADYEALSASEKERMNATAQANQVTNQQTRQAWIESFPYEVVYMANLARRQLARKLNKGRLYLIHDERQPKRASGPYGLFIKSRYRGLSDSGSTQDIFRTMATEWKALSDADKKPFQDMAAAEARKATEQFKEARVAGKAYWQAQKAPAGRMSESASSP
ncbi:HMG (high mobility group) box domain-containing protein [Hirsutella rhossiliensis]|uniref:HMG (High mobility group) box domain-containing protein n=1 Tax=Hirsutella rhossiliensis TaxID=111463 RepID=A0A9P8MLP2_9HYPO|nr:HMG (high mobility group) box domain-containing protein [Hirsutella rhossiliensis]KAH0957430.1 HMG (high mobility group) box domain-containing protein [Hirsutella rhossiliensis]